MFAIHRLILTPLRAALPAAAFCLSLCLPSGAWAQAYPAKTITVIVPFAAGGGVDSTARLVMSKLAENLKQAVVIDNVAGAAGTIGTLKAARAPGDGYTLLFAVASPINVAPLVAPSAVKYDAAKDFLPLATVAVSPFVLIGRNGLQAANTAELLRLARAQPGKLSFGTDGVGTSLHITGELIKQRAGVDILHVPYKSGPQVLTELAGGTLDLAVLPLTLAQPFIKDGKVRAYGVTSKGRWPTMPDVPALAETADLKDLEMESWLGLLAPASISPANADVLVKGLAAVLKDPEIVRKLGDISTKPMLVSGAQFRDYLAREKQLISGVVTRANIKAE
jgi:tripartite-type tricarboxylate transporter receptor subunit TctC